MPWSSKIKAVDLTQFVSPEIGRGQAGGGKEAPINKFLCLTSGTMPGGPGRDARVGSDDGRAV